MTNIAKKVPVTSVPSQASKSPAPSSRPSDFWHPLDNLRRQIDTLFDDFGRSPLRLPFSQNVFDVEPFWHREPFRHVPAVDLSEHPEEFQLSAELPGMDQKDIEIKLSNGNLVIKGEKKEEKEEKRKDYYLSERRFGSFERVFRLPKEVDADKIHAEFAKGVLQVHLPKRPDAVHPEKVIPVKPAD
ncbi:Hsp20/alpha crystallin family protein [Pseudomonas aeruginosa]